MTSLFEAGLRAGGERGPGGGPGGGEAPARPRTQGDGRAREQPRHSGQHIFLFHVLSSVSDSYSFDTDPDGSGPSILG